MTKVVGRGFAVHGPQWTLDKFAQHPFYQDVNRRLVDVSGLRNGQRIVDLGAGTGAVTRLIAQAVAPDGEVIAIEPSEAATATAKRNVEGIDSAPVRFLGGEAEHLRALVREPVDAVFFCNALHLIPDKGEILREIRETLRPNGTFSFNTTFYNGGEPPESELFYRKWMIRSLRVLRSQFAMMPDKTKVEARHRLTEDEYVELLVDNGFEVKVREVAPVSMPLSGFESISEYSLWIEGVLPGVPFEAGAESLRQGAREAFKELALESSPRNWLLVVASRA